MPNIQEKVTSIIYHVTGLQAASKIMEEKRFTLSLSYGKDTEHQFAPNQKKQLYYMSTTRSTTGAYHRSMYSGVIFELNGDFINNNYKSKPVDYFAGAEGKGASGDSKGREFEDRVFSEDQYLDFSKNPKGLIKSIHILHDMEQRENHRDFTFGLQLYTAAKRLGIPTYIYKRGENPKWGDTKKVFRSGNEDWLLMRTEKSLKASEVYSEWTILHQNMSATNNARYGWNQEVSYEKPHLPFGRFNRNPQWTANARKGDIKRTGGWGYLDPMIILRELYYIHNPDQLSKEATNLIRNLSYMGKAFIMKALKDDYRTGAQDPTNTTARASQERMLKLVREVGFKNQDEFLEFLYKKWFAVYNDSKAEIPKPKKPGTVNKKFYRYMVAKNKGSSKWKQRPVENEKDFDDAMDTLSEPGHVDSGVSDAELYNHLLNNPSPGNYTPTPEEQASIDADQAAHWKKFLKNAVQTDPLTSSAIKAIAMGKKAVNESFVPLKEAAGAHTLILFHGSNKVFKEFSVKAKRIENDFFGGGIAYTTDDQKIALTYSRAMTYRYGGEETLYKLEVSFKNLFDVDTIFTGDTLKEFFKYIKVEDFARGAGLLTADQDKYKVLAGLETGSKSLDGKTVFKGLSRGLVASGKAEDILKKMGYDGLRYNGGDNMGGGRHNVYIPYYPNQIKILNVFKVNRKIIKEGIEIPYHGHMTFSREILPQITDQQDFMDHLAAMGYAVGPAERIFPEDYKPTQMDFDERKVVSRPCITPIVVSGDGYILDGHHRWLSAYNYDTPLYGFKVDLPILELIRIAHDFYASEDVDSLWEDYNRANYQLLYHHMDIDKAADVLKKNTMEAKWEHSIQNLAFKAGPEDSDYGEDSIGIRDDVEGNSFTRNLHMSYYSHEKIIVLECDRKKLQDRNKIHVIDADVTVNQADVHSMRKSDNKIRNRNIASRFYAKTYLKKKYDVMDKNWNEFSEEFVEGDIKNINRCIRRIWFKTPLHMISQFGDLRIFIDKLLEYSIRYNIPIVAYPTGRDITDDLVDIVMDSAPNNKPIDPEFAALLAKLKGDFGSNQSEPPRTLTGVVRNIKRSVTLNSGMKL